MKENRRSLQIVGLSIALILLALAGIVFPMGQNKEEKEAAGDGRWVIRQVTHYDEEGNVITYEISDYDDLGNNNRISTYDPDGNLSFYCDYEYDPFNRISIRSKYDAEGRLIDLVRYEYDKNSYVKVRVYDPDNKLIGNDYYLFAKKEHEMIESDDQQNVITRTLYECDNFGNDIKETVYDAEGRLIEERTFINEYDQQGNLIRQSVYDVSGILEKYTINDYDDNAYLIRTCDYDPQDQPAAMIEYEIDEEGDVLSEKRSFADKTKKDYLIRYEYDERDRLIRKYRQDDGEGEYLSYEREFAQEGYALRTIYYSPDQSWTAYENEYNSSGQLTRNIMKDSDGSETVILKREYEQRGILIRETSYTLKGDLQGYTDYENDGKNITESIEYNSQGNIIKTISRKFDENGNVISYLLKGKDEFKHEEREYIFLLIN